MKKTILGGFSKEEYPRNKEGNLVIPLSDVVLHKLTEKNPLMDDQQFKAFKEDIHLNGQMVPVVSYRGKVIDGRHRVKALMELGRETVNLVELPNNITIAEVASKVNSLEKRRHQTPTQLAVAAYKYMIENSTTAQVAADKIGVSKPMVAKCSTISKKVGSEALEKLSMNITVFYNNRNCSSINALYSQISLVEKEEKEAMKRKVETREEHKTEDKRVNKIIDIVEEFSLEDLSYLLKLFKRTIEIKIKDI